jgi:hypothetical protein
MENTLRVDDILQFPQHILRRDGQNTCHGIMNYEGDAALSINNYKQEINLRIIRFAIVEAAYDYILIVAAYDFSH